MELDILNSQGDRAVRKSHWVSDDDIYGFEFDAGYYQVELWQRHGVVVGQTYKYVSFDNVVWC